MSAAMAPSLQCSARTGAPLGCVTAMWHCRKGGHACWRSLLPLMPCCLLWQHSHSAAGVALVHGSSTLRTATDCRRVRVFSFASGKLRRSYDESPEAAAELQRHGGDALKLEPIDFGRRLAVERELIADAEVTQAGLSHALRVALHLDNMLYVVCSVLVRQQDAGWFGSDSCGCP
jgi:hypothetical protein